jgi:hypothetical protein
LEPTEGPLLAAPHESCLELLNTSDPTVQSGCWQATRLDYLSIYTLPDFFPFGRVNFPFYSFSLCSYNYACAPYNTMAPLFIESALAASNAVHSGAAAAVKASHLPASMLTGVPIIDKQLTLAYTGAFQALTTEITASGTKNAALCNTACAPSAAVNGVLPRGCCMCNNACRSGCPAMCKV